MDYIRGWIGVPTSSSDKKVEPEDDPDAGKLLRRNQILLGQRNAELEELNLEIDDDLACGVRDDVIRPKLAKRKTLEAQIKQLQALITNQTAIKDTIATAHANKQQALLVQSASTQLASVVAETEKIDVDEAVDTFKDNAIITQEHSTRLSEPIISYETINPEAESVDDELQRLKDEATLLRMNPAPTTTAAREPRVVKKQPNPIKSRNKRIQVKEEL